MPAAFAALEARVNAACLVHCANAVATHEGVDTDAVFDEVGEVPGEFGVVDSVVTLLVPADAWPTLAINDQVTVTAAAVGEAGAAFRVLKMPAWRDTAFKQLVLQRVAS